MIFNNIKSIRSKIFLSYSMILIIVIIFFNVVFYFFAQRYFYNNTIKALKSISRDVIGDDIVGKNLKNGITLAVHKYAFSIKNVYIQARYKGKVVLKSKTLKNYELPIYNFSKKDKILKIKIKNISNHMLIIYNAKVQQEKNYVVQIATTNQATNKHLSEILDMFIFGDPLFAFIVFLVIYKMLKDILKPMNTMIKTAKEISVTDLDKRILYVDNGDEFADLAKTFNTILSRLQTSFNQVKRFSSDASHQLKTPLTSMRIQTDIALKKDRNLYEYKDVLRSINSEIIYLQNMINNLFLLTQIGDKIIQKKFKSVDLDTILMNAVEEFVVIANTKGINLKIGEINHTVIRAESTLIGVLCSNLIDNAIKYTPKNKSVFIELKDSTLMIEDEGIGIEEKNLKIIFDRFFRVNSSRVKESSGYGLGLSIVENIAEVHNAKISMESKFGVGTKILVKFNPC